MSLLDDVSIVVTPNGYKAGTLYGVLPTYAEGSEELNNTDFATETVWTFTNVDFSVGAVLFDNISDTVFQNWTDTVNTTYKLTITKTGAGTLRFRSGYTGSAATIIDIPESGIIYFTSTSDTNRIQIYGDSGSVNATLNSVSVKEVTSSDMDVTRATAATRVDEAGLVNYAEVLGSELFTSLQNGRTGGSNAFEIFTDNGGGSYTFGSTSTNWAGFESPDSDTFSVEVAQVYKITFDYTQNSGTSALVLSIGNTTVGSSYSSSYTPIAGSNTAYLTIFTTNSSARLISQTNAVEDFTIDNISVKEADRDNVPRIDYTGGGCPHILSEPLRTNLVPYSEDFSNADWGNASIGTTPVLTSGFISPDGTNNAYKISNANQNSMWFSATLIGASDSRTIYARTVSGTGTAQLLSHNSNTNNTFNLTEEWQRFEVSTTTSGIGSTSYYAVDFRGSGTLTELLIWGAQTEVGSYPTSYIPNFGTVAGVTRNQDIFTRDGIGSLINSPEGVLFLEVAALSDDGTNRYLSINDGTTSNYIYFRFVSTSNTVLMRTVVSGVTINTLQTAITDTTDFNKFAFKWKSGDYAFWINGVESLVDASATIFGADVLNQINFHFPTASGTFPSKVKQLQVYDTALTDEQLLQLTGESGTDFYESYAAMASALTYTIQ